MKEDFFKRTKNFIIKMASTIKKIGYKVFIVPLIKVSFTFWGGTLGIWGSFLILNVLFSKVFPTAHFPGLDNFVHHGEILIISFAFLAEALFYSTRDLKINFFNVASVILLITSIFLYVRVIALKSSSLNPTDHDSIIFTYSPICFFASIVLFYFIIVREKYHEESGNIPVIRERDLDTLEEKFNND